MLFCFPAGNMKNTQQSYLVWDASLCMQLNTACTYSMHIYGIHKYSDCILFFIVFFYPFFSALGFPFIWLSWTTVQKWRLLFWFFWLGLCTAVWHCSDDSVGLKVFVMETSSSSRTSLVKVPHLMYILKVMFKTILFHRVKSDRISHVLPLSAFIRQYNRQKS